MWIGGADNNADRGQAVGRHSSTRLGHHPFWRHVDHSGVGRVEVESVLNSWRNLRGDACRRPLVDPRHLREMPLTVLVDREGMGYFKSLERFFGKRTPACYGHHNHLDPKENGILLNRTTSSRNGEWLEESGSRSAAIRS